MATNGEQNGKVNAGAIVSIKEMGDVLEMSRSAIYRLLDADPPVLPAHKVGGKWVIYRAEWRRFLDEGLGPALEAMREREATAPAVDPRAVATTLLEQLEGRTLAVQVGDLTIAVSLLPREEAPVPLRRRT